MPAAPGEDILSDGVDVSVDESGGGGGGDSGRDDDDGGFSVDVGGIAESVEDIAESSAEKAAEAADVEPPERDRGRDRDGGITAGVRDVAETLRERAEQNRQSIQEAAEGGGLPNRQQQRRRPPGARTVDREDIRFAQEPVSVAGQQIRAGEAIPREATQRSIIRQQFAQESERFGGTDLQFQNGQPQIAERARERERREMAERQVEEQLEIAMSIRQRPGEPGPGGVQIEPVDLQRGQDFRVQRGPGGVFRGQLTEEFQRERAIQQARSQLGMPGFRAGEELQVEQTGEGVEVSLTPQGRAALTRTEVAEEGEITLEQPSSELFGFTIGGGEQTREIQDLEQLQFGEEGQLVGVEEAPGQTFEEDVAEIEQRLGGSALARAEAIGLAGSLELLQGAGDVSVEVGETIRDVGSPIPGKFEEMASFPFERSEQVAADLGQEAAAQTISEQGEAISGGVGEFTAGSGRVFPLVAELPETVATGAEVAGEAGAFTVTEGPGEAAEAGGEVVASALERAAQSAVANPVETAGTLAGTAVLMGGAGAVSGRAGLATRAAIQPGEELLGRGGAAVFGRGGGAIRRAAQRTDVRGARTAERVGAGAERAGQVLFPRGEPLFASEEAAIFAGQRLSSLARGAGGRLRRGAGRRMPDLEIETQFQRPRIEGQPRLEGFQGRLEPRLGFEFRGPEFGAEVDVEPSPAEMAERFGQFDPFGRARRELTAARFGLAERFARFRQGLGPESRLEVEQDLPEEPAQIRSPFANPLDIEGDTQTEAEDEFTPEPIEREQPEREPFLFGETGVARQRVTTRQRTEAPQLLLMEQPAEAGRPEAETEVEPEIPQAEAQRPSLGAESVFGMRPEVTAGLGQEFIGRTRPEVGQELRPFETQRPETRLGAENIFETRFETEQRLEAEQETEQEIETEFELRPETELGLEVQFPEPEFPDRDEEDAFPFGPAGEEFVNPVATGAQFLFGPGLGGGGSDGSR